VGLDLVEDLIGGQVHSSDPERLESGQALRGDPQACGF
jgi:hypothetical protein